MTFKLDGTPLTADYDEVADILYLWVDRPRPAVTWETEAGHLVQLDPETREFVGLAIVDYERSWRDKQISFEIPQFERRVLELV